MQKIYGNVEDLYGWRTYTAMTSVRLFLSILNDKSTDDSLIRFQHSLLWPFTRKPKSQGKLILLHFMWEFKLNWKQKHNPFNIAKCARYRNPTIRTIRPDSNNRIYQYHYYAEIRRRNDHWYWYCFILTLRYPHRKGWCVFYSCRTNMDHSGYELSQSGDALLSNTN